MSTIPEPGIVYKMWPEPLLQPQQNVEKSDLP